MKNACLEEQLGRRHVKLVQFTAFQINWKIINVLLKAAINSYDANITSIQQQHYITTIFSTCVAATKFCHKNHFQILRTTKSPVHD